ncbi:MAG: exosortase-associated EpsI family protein [Verrucomicrobiota bacterium]
MIPRSRLAILLIAVLSLGLVFTLPDVSAIRPSAIIMNLPPQVGTWFGKSIQETEEVRKTLASDTNFEKAIYTRRSAKDPDKFQYIHATIVLAGQDPNNSIHRPERCLPAQGNTLLSSSEVTLPVFGIEPLKVTRLRTVGVENGIKNLTYYWFVGSSEVTNSHYQRTFSDMKDRVVGGFNQRWAYVTVAAPYDFEEGEIASGSEEEVSAMIEEFILEVFPRIHRVEMLPLPDSA